PRPGLANLFARVAHVLLNGQRQRLLATGANVGPVKAQHGVYHRLLQHLLADRMELADAGALGDVSAAAVVEGLHDRSIRPSLPLGSIESLIAAPAMRTLHQPGKDET